MATAVVLADSDDTQMGVSCLITGEPYWFQYLDQQVEDAEIDEDTRDEWEERFDGYQFEWEFTSPIIASGDQHIDAMCIHGYDDTIATTIDNDTVKEYYQDYAGGGFCAGIKYVGSFSSQPEKWAVWFTTQEKADWTAALGFEESVDDTEHWRDEDDSATYTTSWKLYRWLPKDERSKDYYTYEYRFEAGDNV